MSKHWKKYLFLFALIVPISVGTIFTLPYHHRYIAVVIFPPLFWMLYYSWITLERKRDR
ncbi:MULTISPECIES: hypothetical protein [Paenibacillus]|uniref:Permease n=1 Tax=Paenibacillus cucumis (ex Kampfer et al. 2016) TaxID=1776858 RepID=A0ABS7KMH7_9BACL|nr:hypothetical protein [Paenibacillus cucumis (ex Kampfer et al. 2016)]MBY0205383.1 hypothetical protein [Paenibacillus cucumis (ex Kampfer et al. 2016)]MDP9698631.1 hypothetical protein [Paenibacillus intestini]